MVSPFGLKLSRPLVSRSGGRGGDGGRGQERSDNSGPWIRRMVGHAAGGSFQATSTRLL